MITELSQLTMITELSQLTMSQYIDIVCGDIDVLGINDSKQANEIRRKLIYDYASISDPTGTSAYVSRRKTEADDTATLLLFRICANLIIMKEIGEVRRILTEYGIYTETMSDKQIELEVDRRMKRAKSMVERNVSDESEKEDAEKTAEDIRRMFDRQAASLMTYFKFQIDFNTIKATTFAYMIDQADKEIKAKKAALARV